MIMTIVALLSLILAIRKAKGFRFLAFYFLRKRKRDYDCSPCKENPTAEETESSFRTVKTSGLGISQTARLV